MWESKKRLKNIAQSNKTLLNYSMKRRNETLHFFSEFYYPACNSTSYYVTKIIHACADEWNGNIRIYCASPLPGEEILKESNIHIARFRDGGLSKNNLVSRLLKFTLLTLNFFSSALFHVKKKDRVLVVTNPAFLLVFFAFLKCIIHFHFTILVYDIFPEVLIPSKIICRESIKYRIAISLFNWSYRKADKIIVIGRDMKEVIEDKTNDSSKTVFIPNWINTEEFKIIPKDHNPILKRFGIEKDFIFSIAGNMGRTQGLDNIIEALSICDLNDHTSFVFMGGGAKKDDIKKAKEKKGLNKVYITGWIPDDEQNAMLCACDVAVISLAEGMYGLSVPSKSYFNMAVSKPLLLIADERSEIARVIAENKIGWIVPPNKPKILAQRMKEIQALSQKELQEIGLKARKTVERFFSEDNILPQYVKLICEKHS